MWETRLGVSVLGRLVRKKEPRTAHYTLGSKPPPVAALQRRKTREQKTLPDRKKYQRSGKLKRIAARPGCGKGCLLLPGRASISASVGKMGIMYSFRLPVFFCQLRSKTTMRHQASPFVIALASPGGCKFCDAEVEQRGCSRFAVWKLS